MVEDKSTIRMEAKGFICLFSKLQVSRRPRYRNFICLLDWTDKRLTHMIMQRIVL